MAIDGFALVLPMLVLGDGFQRLRRDEHAVPLTAALGNTSFLGFLLTCALIGEHLGCANSRVTWLESAVPQSPPVHWR